MQVDPVAFHSLPGTPEKKNKEPSPYTPEKRVPLKVLEDGSIENPLSPGHKHPALYVWQVRQLQPDENPQIERVTELVGVTGNLQARVPNYRCRAKKFSKVLKTLKTLPRKYQKQLTPLIRDIDEFAFDLAANPRSSTLGFRKLQPGELSRAEKTQIAFKRKHGYPLYNKYAGGNGVRESEKENEKPEPQAAAPPSPSQPIKQKNTTMLRV